MNATAGFRQLARKHEARCNWRKAAEYWALAISNYRTVGALADLDKSKMADRRAACIAQAQIEDQFDAENRDPMGNHHGRNE